MKSKVFLLFCFAGISLFILSTFFFKSILYANDSAAEVAAGGIQFKEEKNISIENEELYISLNKIEVGYVFKNHSNRDIVTEIAFPVPEYLYSETKPWGYDFSDFTVEVDGQRINYKTEVRAIVEEKDYTKLLEEMMISVKDFGGIDGDEEVFSKKLNEKDRKTLIDLGILDYFDLFPHWFVSIKYHWTQRFPANSVVKIRHTYAPKVGYNGADRITSADLPSLLEGELFEDACINKETVKRMTAALKNESHAIGTTWVSYILTTANNWRKPIKAFRLVIAVPENARPGLCFDHKISQTRSNRYESYVSNYVPKRDLKVYVLSRID